MVAAGHRVRIILRQSNCIRIQHLASLTFYLYIQYQTATITTPKHRLAAELGMWDLSIFIQYLIPPISLHQNNSLYLVVSFGVWNHGALRLQKYSPPGLHASPAGSISMEPAGTMTAPGNFSLFSATRVEPHSAQKLRSTMPPESGEWSLQVRSVSAPVRSLKCYVFFVVSKSA